MLRVHRAREHEPVRRTHHAQAFGTGEPTATHRLTSLLTADNLPPGAKAAPSMPTSSPVERCAALSDQLEHHIPLRANARKAMRACEGELGE